MLLRNAGLCPNYKALEIRRLYIVRAVMTLNQIILTVSSARDPGYPTAANLQGAQLSRCPVEDGVVRTARWGTVSPGTVLAAIAAGLEPQQVEISLLLAEPAQTDDVDKVEKFDRYRQMALTAQLHNTWAATLAGNKGFSFLQDSVREG